MFTAAADWLREGPHHTVQDAHRERRDTEPAHALRMPLSHLAAEAGGLTALQI